ncbi:hypothetical protein M0D69_02290 [Caballeronia sp. SEWSISQ10-4 2]|uniref:hypothetical protein n=1 Tax=Caballeronia sp. SEWSISQ10-4 2 TaxID=2937438 RepID=UPI0026553652|nr:hypothetical protein [Caballeronia sp. SEWSISQ10-4 2]MDN7176869.1 hypothetical protein [Caballeronia sp. SEWSISQ10-4 2]
MPVHLTEFSRTRRGGGRYLRVETSSGHGARVLFFFRYDDGNWCVFPPMTGYKARAADNEVKTRCR